MPLTHITTKNNLDVSLNPDTNHYYITPEHDRLNILRVCTSESEALEACDDILNSFYNTAETFLQHLSESVTHVTDFDMIAVSQLLNTIAGMKYDNDTMPVYLMSKTDDNTTVIASDFTEGSEVTVTDACTGQISTGFIAGAVVWNDDISNESDIPEPAVPYAHKCTFVKDDDTVITVFITVPKK